RPHMNLNTQFAPTSGDLRLDLESRRPIAVLIQLMMAALTPSQNPATSPGLHRKFPAAAWTAADLS
ncbi:MAG: hypothetical protein ACOYBY_18475, partial [Dermatophilaceae bacterium]